MTRLSILSSIIGAVAVAAQTVTLDGCYSSSGSLQSQGTYIYQSTGYCAATCRNRGNSAMGLSGQECFCGDELPAGSDKVDNSKCNTPCSGYPMDKCTMRLHDEPTFFWLTHLLGGGDGFFSVATLSTSDNITTSYILPTTSATSHSLAPTTSTNATHTVTSASTTSTVAASSYTGAAASAYVGSGALAMGALVAFL